MYEPKCPDCKRKMKYNEYGKYFFCCDWYRFYPVPNKEQKKKQE